MSINRIARYLGHDGACSVVTAATQTSKVRVSPERFVKLLDEWQNQDKGNTLEYFASLVGKTKKTVTRWKSGGFSVDDMSQQSLTIMSGLLGVRQDTWTAPEIVRAPRVMPPPKYVRTLVQALVEEAERIALTDGDFRASLQTLIESNKHNQVPTTTG